MRTGETIPLRKSKGMFILDMWLWIPTGLARAEAPEANCAGDVLVRPMLEALREKELGESVRYLRHEKMKMREKKRWSAKMERRSPRAQKLSMIWDSQAGENKKNMRQLTRNTGVGALRARDDHFRYPSAHDKGMHTFVIDCCFPATWRSAGNNIAGHEGNEDKGSWHVLGYNKHVLVPC